LIPGHLENTEAISIEAKEGKEFRLTMQLQAKKDVSIIIEKAALL
jgi:hypothetical protein